MLTYDLSQRGKKPCYEYLYECIREDILRGKLTPRSKLPSRRDMARDNHISITTVQNAYNQLLMEGYLTSVEKSGYYVANIQTIPKIPPSKPVYPKLYQEDKWFADFRANNTLYHNFPFSTWKKVLRETLLDYEDELIQRGNMFGIEKLRSEISDYLFRTRDITVSPECIIIGSSIEYLYGRIIRMLPESAIFTVENPGYQKISRIYAEYGVPWKIVEMEPNGVNMDSLRASGATIVHVSPEHHYPLGTIMDTERRQEILGWANEHPNRYIIEDDYDCEFRYHSHSIPAMKSMDVSGKVIYMNTFSKTMSPSIRISYMVLPEKLVMRYIQTTNFYNNTASSLEQYALAKFIEQGYFERHVSRIKKFYLQEGLLLRKLLSESTLPIQNISEIESGTHLLVSLDTELSDRAIRQRANRQGINIAFLTDFCIIPKPEFEHVMILNYSDLPPEMLKEAIERLGQCFCES